MMDYDLHIHTVYCGHAKHNTVEAICRQAEALGLSVIAITDHIYEPADREKIDIIRQEVAATAPSCRVLVGAEIDVDFRYTDGRLVLEDVDGLDYVIGGFHYVPTMGHYPWNPEQLGMPVEQFLELWQQSLLGVVSNAPIDTLAHPGRMLAACVALEDYFEYGLSVLRQAAAISARRQIAWELNDLTGQRLSAFGNDNWHRIYQVALEEGVRLVYGSDAHNPQSIGAQSYVQRWLAKLPADALRRPEEIIQRVKV